MFYTVTLPCTLWFLDRGKQKTPRAKKVLFLDARNVFRQVDRAHRDWTPAQIGFLANVVRLYRGEEPDFTLGGQEAKERLIATFGKKPRYQDTLGLCRIGSCDEIGQRGWSLNPGPYVGVASQDEVGNEEFLDKVKRLNDEYNDLGRSARVLEERLQPLIEGILNR
jgi:type I restriction enzyme M protein